MKITVYVCPECGEWGELTTHGYPQYSGTCAAEDHPEAIPIEFSSTYLPRIEREALKAKIIEELEKQSSVAYVVEGG